jgi:hypothetical protein
MGFSRKEKKGHPPEGSLPIPTKMKDQPKRESKKNQDEKKIQMKNESQKKRSDKNQQVLWQ